MRYLPSPAETKRLSPEELRSNFLVENLFVPGTIRLQLIDLDRVILGGAIPLADPLTLEAPADILADYFCERRELGVLNIGAPGSVTVDGVQIPVRPHEVLYIGRGSRAVSFASNDGSTPAQFYLVSYPAHAVHPLRLMTAADADVLELGSTESANRRRVRRYIHKGGASSCQLVMGVTTLDEGSVWNTMPSHTHDRRTEVYLYFQLPSDAMVVHLMGEPTSTRSLIVRSGEVALSPGWSIHAGCGTRAYAFCWAMGGENQDYADMQAVGMETIR